MASYAINLRDRKLEFRLRGWREVGNLYRCGHYWINDSYPGQRFSIYEVGRITKGEKEDEQEQKQENTLHQEEI